MFDHVQPTEEQHLQITVITEQFGSLADDILLRVPAGPERTLAIRRLQEASFWVNHAITHIQVHEPATQAGA